MNMTSMKNISSWMTKALLLTVLFLVQAVASSAQVKLYIEDFTISNGETKEVALLLDNDKEATALQAKIDLPSGLQYVEGSVAKTSRVKGRGASVQASTTTGQLVIVETDGTIDAGSGAVITFQVTRSSAIDGEFDLFAYEIVVSDSNGDQLNTEETQEVKVQFIGLGDCTFSASEAVDVAVGQQYQIDVTLTNDGVNNLSALQGELYLPAGLEIVPGEDGKFIYSDRTPAPLEFKFQEFDGYTSFILSSSSNKLITGNDGVIFSFVVKATESLVENSAIELKNLRVAAVTGQSAKTPDVRISVTNSSIADKAAFDAYKADKTAAVEAMATDDDSEASKALIADAKAALDAMTYDYGKSLDEQKAEIDAVVEEGTAALEAQRAQEAAEAKAVAEATEKLAELKAAAEALAVSEEAKAYDSDNVKTAVAVAEEAIEAVTPVLTAVEAQIAEGKLASDNQEALAEAIAAAEEAIAAASAAIDAAQETYKNQKQIDDAAEAGAKASAEASVTSLKIAMEDVAVNDEAKASENKTIKDAVAAAEEAIAAANDAIAAAEALIAEGKLNTDNKVAIAQAISTFVMPAEAVKVNAAFTAFFPITVAAVENGTVEVAADALVGEKVAIVATPAEGYKVGSCTVTGVNSNIAVAVAEDGTFEMPNDAVTVAVTFEKLPFQPVDMTAKVATDGWKSEVGNVGNYTKDVAQKEQYLTNTTTNGEILYQTVEDLPNGTYTVELYANASYTAGRGFASEAKDGDLGRVAVYAGDVEQTIPVVYQTAVGENNIVKLENVVVSDGTLQIGLRKDIEGSNWHTIQIKSLTQVSDEALPNVALENAYWKGVAASVLEANDKVGGAEKANLAAAETKADVQAALAAFYSSANTWNALADAVATAKEAGIDVAAQEALFTSAEATAEDAAQALNEVAAAVNAKSVEGASFENPVVTNFVVNGTFDTNGVIAPWKSTTGAQNQTTANNQTGDFTGNFFENWNPSPYTGKMYQTIENIPNGVYTLKIAAFVSNFAGEGQQSQYVYANDNKTYLTKGEPTAYEVPLFVVTDNKVEVGFEQTEAVNGWSGIDNVSLVYYGEKLAPMEIALDVERYTGLGYGVTVAEVDFTEAEAFLGVDEITTDMLRIVNPDGTMISDYAPFDGWFNGEGTAETWGANTKICVKFFQAVEDGDFQICDMNGADVLDATYSVKWALVANDKQVNYTINVKFVQAPAIYLADYTQKGETVEVNVYPTAVGTAYNEVASEDYEESAVSALIGEDWEDIYGIGTKVNNKETMTANYSCTPNPGFWCLADGTADVWANGTFGVSLVFNEDYSSFHFLTWTKEALTETLSTTFYLVNSETKEYVAYKVILNSIPTGIASTEAAAAAKKDGKYLEKGKVVIYRNGIKYNAAGQIE